MAVVTSLSWIYLLHELHLYFGVRSCTASDKKQHVRDITVIFVLHGAVYVAGWLQRKPDPVKGKILELIQVWAHAFRNEPQYKIIQDTLTILKVEGRLLTINTSHSEQYF